MKSHRCAHAPPALAHTTQVAKHSAEALLSGDGVIYSVGESFVFTFTFSARCTDNRSRGDTTWNEAQTNIHHIHSLS